MPLPFRLLAITPPTGPVDPGLVDRWQAVAPGVPLAVLLREPGAAPPVVLDPSGRLGPLARRCRDRAIPLLLSLDLAHLDLALAAPGLAGLHLRGDPPPARLPDLRRRVPGLFGRACHGAPQPGHEHVDYTLLAPIFPPTTAQPGLPLGSKKPIGLDGLRAWTADPRAVVVALGGIGPATAAACLAAGAAALAGIGVFFGPPDRVEQDVAALGEQLRAAHVLPPPPRS
ncbi:MAG TPA: thiamine phosphate synthase [Nannocystis sp.]